MVCLIALVTNNGDVQDSQKLGSDCFKQGLVRVRGVDSPPPPAGGGSWRGRFVLPPPQPARSPTFGSYAQGPRTLGSYARGPRTFRSYARRRPSSDGSPSSGADTSASPPAPLGGRECHSCTCRVRAAAAAAAHSCRGTPSASSSASRPSVRTLAHSPPKRGGGSPAPAPPAWLAWTPRGIGLKRPEGVRKGSGGGLEGFGGDREGSERGPRGV
eukprot:1178809-Prorocentrum_minimum.AAC.1